MKNKKNAAPLRGPRNGSSRREELLQAAARLIRKKGYVATTIRDITGEVGMGSGSPFCHFRNKQEILDVIATRGMEMLLGQAEHQQNLHMAPGDLLKTLMQLHAAAVHGQIDDFAAVMLHEWHVLPVETRRRLAPLMERYEGIWNDCIEALEQAAHLNNDPKLSAHLILGSLNWSLNWFPGDGRQAASDLVEAAASVFQIASTPQTSD